MRAASRPKLMRAAVQADVTAQQPDFTLTDAEATDLADPDTAPCIDQFRDETTASNDTRSGR